MIPLLPKDSGVLGKGVFGDMVLGQDYTRIPELTTTYPDHPIVLIECYTAAMVSCGVVDDYESFTYTANWWDLDTFELEINRYKTNVSKIVVLGYIRFEMNGIEYWGVIESRDHVLDQDGKASETLKFSGRGPEAIFAQYPCMYGTATGTGTHDTPIAVIPTLTFTFAASTTVTASASCLAYAKVGHYIFNSTNDTSAKSVEITAISVDGITITLANAYAGTAGSGKAATLCGCAGETFMRSLVDKECISTSDAGAVLSGLSLAVHDYERGGIVVRAVRYDYLHDILYGICKESALSFRLVHGTGLTFVFTVFTGTDRSATVTITPEYGNVETLRYVQSLLEMKNLLYVGGTGDGAARIVRKVFNGTEPTGWNRRAKFIDATDCTTNALLDARGAETLATTGQSLSLEVEYLESPTFRLGTHFFLGDIITAMLEDVVTMVTRITSITYLINSDGKKITLGLGKDAPNLVSIMELNKKLNSALQKR